MTIAIVLAFITLYAVACLNPPVRVPQYAPCVIDGTDAR